MISQQKVSYIILLLISLTPATISAQRVFDTTTINLFDEMDKIQAAYTAADHLSFNAVYYLTDTDTLIVKDTSQASFKINGNNFYLMMDSVETVQNDLYLATMYHQDSTIVVEKPTEVGKEVLKLNVNDPTFQQIGMKGMTFTDSSGGGANYRKVNILFDSVALYKQYQVVFDKATYRITYLKYSVRKNYWDASVSHLPGDIEKTTDIFISFSNYQTGTYSDNAFRTDTYFKVQDSGTIIPVGTQVANFQVINQISQ